MSVHYILDGYNILKQLPHLTNKRLREGRQELIHYLEIKRPQGSLKNKVTIVFDGKQEVIVPYTKRLKGYNIEVIFTQGDETADDKIRKIAKRNIDKGKMIIVTDDKELRLSLQGTGVKTIHVREFIKQRKSVPEKIVISDKTALPYEKQLQITDELTKIWLNDES